MILVRTGYPAPHGTIRIWDSENATVVEGHADAVKSIAYFSDRQHIVSGSFDDNTPVRNPFSYVPIRPFSYNPIHPGFCARVVGPGTQRVAYSIGPYDYRNGLHSPALLTIPLSSCSQFISLDTPIMFFLSVKRMGKARTQTVIKYQLGYKAQDINVHHETLKHTS